MHPPDKTLSFEERFERETVWLTQQQMTELFRTQKVTWKNRQYVRNPYALRQTGRDIGDLKYEGGRKYRYYSLP